MEMPKYKNIRFSVRPRREVAFINKNDPNWKDNAIGFIKSYSEHWGGAYNLIIPTDGSNISDEFWAILEKYNPDYFISNLTIGDSLDKELKQRLSPFCHGNYVAKPYIASWTITRIRDIIQYTNIKKFDYFDLESCIDDPLLRLLLYSHVGKASKEYLDELGKLEIELQPVCDKYLIQNYLVDPIGTEVSPQESGKDFAIYTPFSVSMVNLGIYYKPGEYYYDRPVGLVLGDTIEDFCFFYCLSRMHGDFYWLPLSFLKKN